MLSELVCNKQLTSHSNHLPLSVVSGWGGGGWGCGLGIKAVGPREL